MNLTGYDRRRGHGAWVRGQINSTRWRYSHYNTYPIPTAASRNHGAVTRSRCGDGVSVVMTVSPSGGVDLGWIFESQTASELTTVGIVACSLDFVLEH